MINIHVQCPVLLWVWLQFELVCDDPRNTVVMTPPSISHIEGEDWGRDEKVGKDCRDGIPGCGDDEVRVSRVGGVVVWLVTFARIRASAKARLLDDPDYPNQQAKQTNKKKNRNDMLMHFRSWKIACHCTTSVSCCITYCDSWMGVSLAERTCWPWFTVWDTATILVQSPQESNCCLVAVV